MKELFKKYWFIFVVGIAMICFIFAYSFDSLKNRKITVDTVKDGDKYVIATVDNNKYYYADELYSNLYDRYGIAYSWNAFSRAVCDMAIEEDTDLKTNAGNYASYLLQNDTNNQLDTTLKQNGYPGGSDDVLDFAKDQFKLAKLLNAYFKENADPFVNKYVAANNPRKIYHILVKVANVEKMTDEDGKAYNQANPTAEESAKLEAVLEALKTKDFKEVAKELSEDSSNTSGGYVGVISSANSNQYDSAFAEAALALNINEVSEVVVSQFGYHIILAEEAPIEELIADDSFMEGVANSYPYNSIKAIYEKAMALGFTIEDEALQSEIDGVLKEAESEVAK